ncbi:Uncharacterized protein FWK35_00019083 [Aphis craccivora]|uniref:Uncharacterized protein n=1 Tax=Aphis craccivora TaxID=307492 RepID=A0A6G0YW12_APHCR|nr:Uncharacterized protein FWK35_00019083 [Aphis craccivora]
MCNLTQCLFKNHLKNHSIYEFFPNRRMGTNMIPSPPNILVQLLYIIMMKYIYQSSKQMFIYIYTKLLYTRREKYYKLKKINFLIMVFHISANKIRLDIN